MKGRKGKKDAVYKGLRSALEKIAGSTLHEKKAAGQKKNLISFQDTALSQISGTGLYQYDSEEDRKEGKINYPATLKVMQAVAEVALTKQAERERWKDVDDSDDVDYQATVKVMKSVATVALDMATEWETVVGG